MEKAEDQISDLEDPIMESNQSEQVRGGGVKIEGK